MFSLFSVANFSGKDLLHTLKTGEAWSDYYSLIYIDLCTGLIV